MQSPFLKKLGKEQLGTPTGIKPGDWITVFADASYCDQTKAYGVAWWVKHGVPPQTHVGSDGGTGMLSSLEAEVAAMEHALAYVIANIDVRGKNICVQSDCTGAIVRIETGTHFTQLLALGAKRAYCKHVHGHRGNATPRHSVNTTCDQLARRRMKHYRQQVRDALASPALEASCT